MLYPVMDLLDARARADGLPLAVWSVTADLVDSGLRELGITGYVRGASDDEKVAAVHAYASGWGGEVTVETGYLHVMHTAAVTLDGLRVLIVAAVNTEAMRDLMRQHEERTGGESS